MAAEDLTWVVVEGVVVGGVDHEEGHLVVDEEAEVEAGEEEIQT